MAKFTRRGERAALLDAEEPGDPYRLETRNIPHPTLEDVAGDEALEAERAGAFLRTRERVPTRRRSKSRWLGSGRWVRLAVAASALAALALLAFAVWETETVLLHNPHFVLSSSSNIQVNGNRVVHARQALAVFSPDTGRSIFRVPLARHQAEIEKIDWVRAATVMRLWPNRLRVSIVERTPVAFAREGNSVQLVDDDGVLLDLPDGTAQRYSFPVVTGISAFDPAATRAARMQLYRQLMRALDAEGGKVSESVSEVDLSDPEDLRAVFVGTGRSPLVHLGDSDFLARYRAYQAHLTEWLQQYPNLRSVDMRYGQQIVLDTGTQPVAKASPAVALEPSGSSSQPPPAAASPKTVAKHPGRRTKKIGRRFAKSRVVRKRKARKRAPERGHPVRDPIAHVVSGA